MSTDPVGFETSDVCKWRSDATQQRSYVTNADIFIFFLLCCCQKQFSAANSSFSRSWLSLNLTTVPASLSTQLCHASTLSRVVSVFVCVFTVFNSFFSLLLLSLARSFAAIHLPPAYRPLCKNLSDAKREAN